MNTIRPVGDHILVTPYRRERTRAGGIMLTEKNRDILSGDDHVFWVVAVSGSVKHIKVKDRVLCKFDHEGLEMLTDGTRRGFVRAGEVLAILPHEPFEDR